MNMKLTRYAEPSEWSGRNRWALLASIAIVAAAAATHVQAQDPADPPGRVARLSDAVGQVWLYNADGNEWVSIGRNRPLTSGDHIATDNGARAEISLGTTRLRLDAATELEVVQLDDQRFVVHLVGGSVGARLRTAQAVAEFELDTDEGQFHAQAAGRYRFDRFQQASDVTVYAGQAVFDGRNSELPVPAGEHAQFWVDAAGAAQYSNVAPVRDAFAVMNDERDRAEDRVAPDRYVSAEMTGAEDLDNYGAWEQTPEYGAVWTPRGVAVDWAPYRTGRWAFVRPWGWTWVDEAPWGFAPFHYGRWVRYREAWCWAPGTYVARPVYAPALVAWIGGPRVGVSLSIGGGGGAPVGWFPLAPHEVYVPSYRTSETYIRNVNVTHVTNITNITTIVNSNRNGEVDRRDFANRRFPNAVTVVPASVLTGRQAVGPVAAQYRDNPQVRAMVAEARPGPAMLAAPVAAPPAGGRGIARPLEARPPFDNRATGGFSGSPGREAGALPATPTRSPMANTAPANAVVRPPPRGGIGREPAPAEAGVAPQRLIPASPVQHPVQANEPPARMRAESNGGRVAAPPGTAVAPMPPQQRAVPLAEPRGARVEAPRGQPEGRREERRDDKREPSERPPR